MCVRVCVRGGVHVRVRRVRVSACECVRGVRGVRVRRVRESVCESL